MKNNCAFVVYFVYIDSTMKNNKELVTVRIRNTPDENRVKILDSVIETISMTTGVNANYTDAVNWLIKQYDEDRIAYSA